MANDSASALITSFHYASQAVEMMRARNISPTAKNYAVFYAYASGQPAELVRDINKAIEQQLPLSEDALSNLYHQHVAEGQSRVVQDTTASTRKLLSDMLQTMLQFTGATQEVGQQVQARVAKLSAAPSEEELRAIAGEIVAGAQNLKASGDSVSAKLAASQKEIISLRENLAKATSESERDFLTGTYNRKAFDKRLLESMGEAKEKNASLVLMMLDVDHFKKFNDTYGHLIGDEVLKIVAKTLTDSVKGMDTVARYGGEEFAVILPKTPIGGGMIVGDAIRKAIASRELKRKDTGANYGQITISVGVAAYRPDQDTPDSLIKRADEALYRSKNAGRNRVTQEHLTE
ncbi:MAG: GGDEF domain-containing protein [Alphaproteobacteria bacterium]|nr:GGDEF domain-containing protein [Alphaproteobacteria bacterium]